MIVKEWAPDIHVHKDLESIIKGWVRVSGYQTKFNHTKFLMYDLITLQLSKHWGSLYEMCRTAERESTTYPIMFAFAAITFGSQPDILTLLRTLLAFAVSPLFDHEDPPTNDDTYDLSSGFEANLDSIQRIVSKHQKRPVLPSKPFRAQSREYAEKTELVQKQIKGVAGAIFEQWPAVSIMPLQREYSGVSVALCLAECQPLFDLWHKNSRFLTHISYVSSILELTDRTPKKYSRPGATCRIDAPTSIQVLTPSLESLLLRSDGISSSENICHSPISLSWSRKSGGKERTDFNALDELVKALSSREGDTHKQYASDLRSSLDAFHGLQVPCTDQQPRFDVETFKRHHFELARSVEARFMDICQSLDPSSDAEAILADAGLWPRISESRLLTCLSSTTISKLNDQWHTKLLSFAECIASLQRAERMLKLAKVQDYRTLSKELENPGREGWTSKEHPSWLLLEIENNITIRPLQAKVAKHMIKPSSGANSVMQLNMGEGKSSVIVPMVATALADGSRLVRIVVLQPLLQQTEQVLLERLGGLLGHRICHIPFSRRTRINVDTISSISNIMADHRNNRGVMISLPEEILSMKLMTREKILSDRMLAVVVLDLQRFLESTCRDVVDESDEILGIKSQLIYPVGSQQMLDGKNNRWLVAQGVLRRVKQHAIDLSEQFPFQLNANLGSKSFPDINFLDPAVFTHLLNLLVDDALEGRIIGLSLNHLSARTRVAIRNFIRSREVSEQDLAIINDECTRLTQWSTILILRGLFAFDVLSFVLQYKRWLVEYGLDPTRCLMAVPYRAKGVPTPNSEFSHPEVAILLTCLSYYYSGLSMSQVERCFKILLKEANAHDIYASWALAGDLPANLSSLDSVNLDDRVLCRTELFPRMQYNLECIDFFLNQVVFPREGKEFLKRLSASGWDIPSTSQSPDLLTTGFSGTNDSRVILPYSIKQNDLDELEHTNAMVLNLLLRPENQKYIHGNGACGKRLSIIELLTLISQQQPVINVLIDVGAQVLEATNFELVRQWLKFRTDAKAAVYFDNQDEPMVLDRSGNAIPLRISPLSGKLDNCLIYMDEVHTRGIDLAIPVGAHAAITLGPRLVKDRLTQGMLASQEVITECFANSFPACMCLRQLGNGHSLCFVAPTEVHRSICDMRGCEYDTALTSFDVLAWSMDETCRALETAKALRTMQGLEYLRQQKVFNRLLPSRLPSTIVTANEFITQRFWDEIQEVETRSLELLYGVHDKHVSVAEHRLDRGSSNPMMQHLICQYDSTESAVIEDCNIDNEHERELAHEIEREVAVELPPPAFPRQHAISAGICRYIETGESSDLEKCEVMRAFAAFKDTSAAQTLKRQEIDPAVFDLWMSVEFWRAVDLPQSSPRDHYMPPVNWVVSSTKNNSLLIISPFEANELLPQIKKSRETALHTFAPRVNKAMVSFSNLNFYTLTSISSRRSYPVGTVRALNLFAGSLYLDSRSKYEALRGSLGLISQQSITQDITVQSDGFVDPEDRKEIRSIHRCPFSKSPVPFLKEVMMLRRNGQEFDHTHLGHLLGGRELGSGAFNGLVAGRDAKTG